ncbi:MAG: sigma-70 family RNA polymerase sigma factor [Deltaproteobacteria bacterium]|nr:MAG: sigma-70 family RNA polymerase sigma factor [Deltaproteobacteria bacterium]
MDTSADPGLETGNSDEAIAACHADHAPGLERYVRSLVRDSDEAADVCQEAFVRLLLAGRDGRLPDAPGAWLRRVAHNLVVSGHRHRQIGDRVLGRLIDDETGTSLEDRAIRHEENEAIVSALGNLATDDRKAIVLAAQGYRGIEIARALGRSELASRALLCRARGRLSAHLAAAAV